MFLKCGFSLYRLLDTYILIFRICVSGCVTAVSAELCEGLSAWGQSQRYYASITVSTLPWHCTLPYSFTSLLHGIPISLELENDNTEWQFVGKNISTISSFFPAAVATVSRWNSVYPRNRINRQDGERDSLLRYSGCAPHGHRIGPEESLPQAGPQIPPGQKPWQRGRGEGMGKK